MRFALAALAALSLTACFSNPSEPLGSFGDDDGVNEVRVERALPGSQLNARVVFEQPAGEPVDGQPDESPPPDGNTDPLVAEVAATIDYASAQAFVAADAGNFRDRASAQFAAIELANAAALVAQRAGEFHALSSTAGEGGGCGSEPVEGGEGELPTPVDEAVTVSALAAELGGEIADTLDPPSELVCGSGCGATCEEVPGTVDEEILALAIEGVLDAAHDCADLGIELGAPNAL